MGPSNLLVEEEIDDILYYSRINELAELKAAVSSIASAKNLSPEQVIGAAIDPEDGNTALHYASANNHLDILTFLTSSHTPSQSPSTTTTTPDPKHPLLNYKNTAGNTPLHWAAINGHVPILQHLLSSGADPSILNDAGHDALFEAEINSREDAVKLLLGEGGDRLMFPVVGISERDEEDVDDVDDGVTVVEEEMANVSIAPDSS